MKYVLSSGAISPAWADICASASCIASIIAGPATLPFMQMATSDSLTALSCSAGSSDDAIFVAAAIASRALSLGLIIT